MKIPFVKYQGTGNDFVILDQRAQEYIRPVDQELIARICDRRLGIGADGLMLIVNDSKAPFRMVYYNADGNESTMCGNGGRCIAHYAGALGIIEGESGFVAIDGWHDVKLFGHKVKLKMNDVYALNYVNENEYTLDTGSPHYVKLIDKIPEDVNTEGRRIRMKEPYKKEGINVNFVECDMQNNKATVATYERGVEAETLSCGTGVTAAALVCAKLRDAKSPFQIQTKGGDLLVEFTKTEVGFTDVWLSGPATFVFSGIYTIS